MMIDSNKIWKHHSLKKSNISESSEIQNWKLYFIELSKPQIVVRFQANQKLVEVPISSLHSKEDLISKLKFEFGDYLLDSPTHVVVKRKQDKNFKSIEIIEEVLKNPGVYSNTTQFLAINDEEYRFCETCGCSYNIKSLLPKTCSSHDSSKEWYQYSHPNEKKKKDSKKDPKKDKKKK
jgi:hypothetical protein